MSRSVHVVADDPARIAALRVMLEPGYAVSSALLGSQEAGRGEFNSAVVAADLRVAANIAALKDIGARLGHARKRIFVIDSKEHLFVVQAYALGATRVLFNPLSPRDLQAQLADSVAAGAARGETPAGAQKAASAGAAAFASMFSAVMNGKPVDVADAEFAGSRIADSIADDGLSAWLTAVRRHHEGTYQHCLLVTGIAVDFGLSLGLPGADIRRLYSAAMFHDIGKARIPTAVLDKPGRLDSDERALVETHPAAGYDILKGTAGISPEVLDAVRHHHEYLDGSGYPDALCAASISDIVRILTISDIFAALIEDRRYKPPMPRARAYEIISGMHGKLERPLVVAFRDVALTR